MAGRLQGARCLSWQSIIGLLQLQSFLVSVQSYTACACIVQACGLVSVFKQQDVHSTVFFLQCFSVWLLLLYSHCVPSIWGCSCCVVLGARAALPAYVLVLNQVDQLHVHCCTWSSSGLYCSGCAGSLIWIRSIGSLLQEQPYTCCRMCAWVHPCEDPVPEGAKACLACVYRCCGPPLGSSWVHEAVKLCQLWCSRACGYHCLQGGHAEKQCCRQVTAW